MGDPESKWPPYISSCPDYLTKLDETHCIDLVGLKSRLLVRSDPNNLPAVTDVSAVFDASGSTSVKASRAQQYGLSWEGIV